MYCDDKLCDEGGVNIYYIQSINNYVDPELYYDYDKEDLKKVVEKYYNAMSKEEKDNVIGDIEELTIDGEKAYRFIARKFICENLKPDNTCYHQWKRGKTILIFTEHNKKKYLIESRDSEISQKVLSSLKFLD